MDLKEHMRRIDLLIDDMRQVAETRFLRKVRRLSRVFPDRIFQVVGGMGGLDVYISPKQTHNVDAVYGYKNGGRVEYKLSHGGPVAGWDAPLFLQDTRDWLYLEMENIEADSVLWHFGPMIAPGMQYYMNGEPTESRW